MNARPLLVIGNKNYSSWSLRPWLLLRHHGIAFDEVRLPLDTPEFAAAIGQWSPTRQVPVLRHGELTLWDSLAICEYVNETWLDGAGWPRAVPARALARVVSAEMHAGFLALRRSLPQNCRRRASGFVVNEAAQRDIDRVRAIWRDCRTRHAAEGAFLFGAFTIADAMYAPVALRLLSYGVPVDGIERRYIDALLDLPALQEWLQAAELEVETVAATDAIS